MEIPGDTWKWGNEWKYMEMGGKGRRYMEIYGNVEIHGNTWKYMEMGGNTLEHARECSQFAVR
ncbi:MAG: hypothetical protein H6559_32230 [Lewinellaceae bacterium]|nr:hypothetical protein [Lewinellaceae bacterium]